MKPIYTHGKTFGSCEICDEEFDFLNTGVKTTLRMKRKFAPDVIQIGFMCHYHFAQSNEYLHDIISHPRFGGLDIEIYKG